VRATRGELTAKDRITAQLRLAVPEELRLFDADITAQLLLHESTDGLKHIRRFVA
jgi:hypothetical protein